SHLELTSLTFETEVPVDRDWSTPFGVYHYDARGATEECADLLGQQSGSRQYRKSGFAPPRNWASTSIRLLPLSRCSTAERLCPLLPARTDRRDYSGREPGPVRSVPAIAVAGSTRRRSLLEAAEQRSTKMRCRWVRRAIAGPKSRSSGSIGSRGCQGPLDVGSGSGQALCSGRVLRNLRRCVCAASEEVRGAIGVRHGVDLPINWAEPHGSSKCRYRGSALHMVIRGRVRRPAAE